MMLYINDVDQSIFKANNQVSKGEDRFNNYKMAFLKTTTMQSMDYEKYLPLHEREKYSKALTEFNNIFQNCHNRDKAIFTMFFDFICLKEIFSKRKTATWSQNHETIRVQETNKRQR